MYMGVRCIDFTCVYDFYLDFGTGLKAGYFLFLFYQKDEYHIVCLFVWWCLTPLNNISVISWRSVLLVIPKAYICIVNCFINSLNNIIKSLLTTSHPCNTNQYCNLCFYVLAYMKRSVLAAPVPPTNVLGDCCFTQLAAAVACVSSYGAMAAQQNAFHP